MGETARLEDFCGAIVGRWVGRREAPGSGSGAVEAVWENTLEGRFLQERWFVADARGVMRLSAVSLVRVEEGSPAECLVAYATGRIGLAESACAGREWILSHRWLGGPVDAEIRVRLVGADRYEQEVFALEEDGRRTLESRSALEREAAPGR